MFHVRIFSHGFLGVYLVEGSYKTCNVYARALSCLRLEAVQEYYSSFTLASKSGRRAAVVHVQEIASLHNQKEKDDEISEEIFIIASKSEDYVSITEVGDDDDEVWEELQFEDFASQDVAESSLQLRFRNPDMSQSMKATDIFSNLR